MGSKSDDPLALVMAPPPDENSEQQAARLAREAEARRISEAIDEQLKKERAEQKKGKIVKLLLLGQSESGKCGFPSTPEILHVIPFDNMFSI